MKRLIIITGIIYSFVLYSCKEDATLTDYGWYTVETLSPTSDSEGINCKAVILTTGMGEIAEKGFIVKCNYATGYGVYYPPVANTYIVNNEPFELRLEEDFDDGGTCEVTAFIKTSNQTYYGETKLVQTKGSNNPVISEITPSKPVITDVITIKGSYFSSNKERVQIFVNNLRAELINTSANEITFKASLNLPSYSYYPMEEFVPVTVQIGQKTVTLSESLMFKGFTVESITPEYPYQGEMVSIKLKDYNPIFRMSTYINGILNTTNKYIFENEEILIRFVYPYYTEKVNSLTLSDGNMHVTQKIPFTSGPSWNKFGNYIYQQHPYNKQHSFIHKNCLYYRNETALFRYNLETKQESIFNFPVEGLYYETFIFLYKDELWFNEFKYGATTNTDIYKFNINTEQWTAIKTPLPQMLSAQACLVGNEVYLSFYIINANGTSSIMFGKYIPDSNQWIPIAGVDQLLYKMFHYNGYLYYVGRDLYKIKIGEWNGNEEKEFSFPLYYSMDNYMEINSPIIVGNELYFDGIVFMFKYNLDTKELNSIGSLDDTLNWTDSKSDFLYFYNNQLVAGRKGNLYSFTGRYTGN